MKIVNRETVKEYIADMARTHANERCLSESEALSYEEELQQVLKWIDDNIKDKQILNSPQRREERKEE